MKIVIGLQVGGLVFGSTAFRPMTNPHNAMAKSIKL